MKELIFTIMSLCFLASCSWIEGYNDNKWKVTSIQVNYVVLDSIQENPKYSVTLRSISNEIMKLNKYDSIGVVLNIGTTAYSDCTVVQGLIYSEGEGGTNRMFVNILINDSEVSSINEFQIDQLDRSRFFQFANNGGHDQTLDEYYSWSDYLMNSGVFDISPKIIWLEHKEIESMKTLDFVYNDTTIRIIELE